MKKVALLTILFCSTIFAKVDYSAMSTEELLAMMGYVSPKNKSRFEAELKARIKIMTPKEKKIYLKNLAKKVKK